MRLRMLFGVLGLCLPGAGCSLFVAGTRNVIFEATDRTERALESFRNGKLANAAWDAVEQANPRGTFSPDYISGFKDGFVDYLEAGGTGEPPPLPPARYWKVRYQTPTGLHAAEEWFAGFRDGAAAARASGTREGVVLPLALHSPGPVPPHPVPPLPAPVPPAPIPGPPLLPEEPAPATRQGAPAAVQAASPAAPRPPALAVVPVRAAPAVAPGRPRRTGFLARPGQPDGPGSPSYGGAEQESMKVLKISVRRAGARKPPADPPGAGIAAEPPQGPTTTIIGVSPGR